MIGHNTVGIVTTRTILTIWRHCFEGRGPRKLRYATLLSNNVIVRKHPSSIVKFHSQDRGRLARGRNQKRVVDQIKKRLFSLAILQRPFIMPFALLQANKNGTNATLQRKERYFSVMTLMPRPTILKVDNATLTKVYRVGIFWLIFATQYIVWIRYLF